MTSLRRGWPFHSSDSCDFHALSRIFKEFQRIGLVFSPSVALNDALTLDKASRLGRMWCLLSLSLSSDLLEETLET